MGVNGAGSSGAAGDRPAAPVDVDQPAGAELPNDLAVDGVDDETSQEVMSLLNQHVPLALLADLAIPQGPSSPDILDAEGLPEVAWWEPGEAGPDVAAGADTRRGEPGSGGHVTAGGEH